MIVAIPDLYPLSCFKISANPDKSISKFFLQSNFENKYPYFVFLSSNKNIIGV